MITYLTTDRHAPYHPRRIGLSALPTWSELAEAAGMLDFLAPERRWWPHVARDGSLLLLLTLDTGHDYGPPRPLGVAVVGPTEPTDLQALRRGCLSCGQGRGRLCVVRRPGRPPHYRAAPHPRRLHVDPPPPRKVLS